MTNLKQSEFVPANSLEQRLVEAAKDPRARPAFYRELLESDLLVLGFTNSGGGDGHFVAQVGDTVSIAHWTGQDGAQFIPVFSSMQRLREAISQMEKYLQLNARSLFEMTQGMPVVLNPGAAYGKEFTIEEIRGMLDGSIFKVTQRHGVEQEQDGCSL